MAAHILRQHFGSSTFTTSEAAAVGVTPDRLERAARAGVISRLKRGSYTVGDDGWGEARLRQRELQGRGVDAVMGVRSAAAFWDVPEFGEFGPLPPPRLTLMTPADAPVRFGPRRGLHLLPGYLRCNDVVERCGLRVTTPLRTGFDVARHHGRGRRSALVPLVGGMRAEVAQRRGLASHSSHEVTRAARDELLCAQMRADLADMLEASPRHGTRWIRSVIDDVDPLFETVAETLAWSALLLADLPRPRPQAVVHGISGKGYRSDFLIGERVILEVDGAIKYVDQTPWQEKQRQSDLEAAGYWVVRCTWEELLHHPERVIARVYLALTRAA